MEKNPTVWRKINNKEIQSDGFIVHLAFLNDPRLIFVFVFCSHI